MGTQESQPIERAKNSMHLLHLHLLATGPSHERVKSSSINQKRCCWKQGHRLQATMIVRLLPLWLLFLYCNCMHHVLPA